MALSVECSIYVDWRLMRSDRLFGSGQLQSNHFCRLYGTTKLFDDAQLSVLYLDKQVCIDAIDKETPPSARGLRYVKG